jgi:tetratricopeptide (TPR) repeat protein
VHGLRATLLAVAFLALQPKVGAVLPAQESEKALVEQISLTFEAGQIDAALQRARAAIAQYPRSATLHQLLGAALFKKGLNSEARAAFRRAIELAPNVPQNYFNLALVDLSENKYPDAVKSLEAFLRFEPANAQARVLLGRAYHNLNRTLPAIEQFQKALELAPQLPLIHYHLGYAYQSQGNLKAALEEFRKEIHSNPAFHEPYWLAGNIELGQGDLDAAGDSFRKGIELRPQAYQGHYGLARVLIARKQLQEAEIELKKAVELNPSNVEVHYALARTYQQMGKKADAEREYKVVADIHSRHAGQRSGIAGQQQ